MFIRFIVAGASLLLLGGCDPIIRKPAYTETSRRCHAPIGRTAPDTITLCGPLVDSTADAFEVAIAKKRPRALRISSPGGETGAAIRIARAVNDNDLAVVVDGICESACAYLVLSGAKSVSLTPGSLITLHHTTSMVATAASQRQSTRALANTKAIAEEEAFYRSNGMEPRALYIPGLALGAVCVGNSKKGNEITPTLFSRKGAYIPTLAEAGLFIPSLDRKNYPRDERDALSRYARFHGGRSTNAVYGIPAGVNLDQPSRQVRQIPECGTR